MKKTTLNWFDRLMLSVTFAEAGVHGPGRNNDEQPANRNNACSQEEGKAVQAWAGWHRSHSWITKQYLENS